MPAKAPAKIEVRKNLKTSELIFMVDDEWIKRKDKTKPLGFQKLVELFYEGSSEVRVKGVNATYKRVGEKIGENSQYFVYVCN